MTSYYSLFTTAFLYAFLVFLLGTSGKIGYAFQFTHDGNSLGDTYRPCLVQLFGAEQFRSSTLVPAVAARLSVILAKRYSQRHGYAHILYNCGGHGYCSKASSIEDACFSRQCTHVFYIDTDVMLHKERVDVIRYLVDDFNATITLGLDYYNTIKNPKWHDGTKRQFRTDSNAGMAVVACRTSHTRRILSEWQRLCRRFSPTHDDQEAITLMETLPQFARQGVFARDTLFLGQYSLVARHFPGDSAKKKRYPLPTDQGYSNERSLLQGSGLYKWVDAYWRKRGHALPETEKWRLANDTSTTWEGIGINFYQCPMKTEISYVGNVLRNLDLGTSGRKSLDSINENAIQP